jgi:hypothetical protein
MYEWWFTTLLCEAHPAAYPAWQADVRDLYPFSVGAIAADDRQEGSPEDLQVQREGPVFHVADVEPLRLVRGEVPPDELPQAGKTWLDRKARTKVILVLRYFGGQCPPLFRRAVPDEARPETCRRTGH